MRIPLTPLISLLILIMQGIAPPASAEEYVGTVNHVLDADTIRVEYQGGQIRVRLAAIDMPRNDTSRQALSRLLLGRTVHIEGLKWDSGYLIGRLSSNDEADVCSGLLTGGYGKLNPDYTHTTELKRLEAEARRERRGVWSDFKETAASNRGKDA